MWKAVSKKFYSNHFQVKNWVRTKGIKNTACVLMGTSKIALHCKKIGAIFSNKTYTYMFVYFFFHTDFTFLECLLLPTHTRSEFVKLMKNWRCENYGCKEMPVIVLWIFFQLWACGSKNFQQRRLLSSKWVRLKPTNYDDSA